MTRPRILVGYTGLWLLDDTGPAVWARHVEFDWLADELEREALTPAGRALVAELRARRARAAGTGALSPPGPGSDRPRPALVAPAVTSHDDRGGADPVAQRNGCLLLSTVAGLTLAVLVGVGMLLGALLAGWRP